MFCMNGHFIDSIGLSCEADAGVSEVTIGCVGPEIPLQCSFDGGPLHSCK